MNIVKFEQRIAKDPWLMGHIGTPRLQSGATNNMVTQWKTERARWVRERIGFIADRPWEALSLADGSWRSQDGSFSISTGYLVYLHIEGEEPSFTRARWVNHQQERGENTIEEVLIHLSHWHQGYWAKLENRPLRIDAVLKIMTQFIEGKGIQTQSFEIYRPPPDFHEGEESLRSRHLLCGCDVCIADEIRASEGELADDPT